MTSDAQLWRTAKALYDKSEKTYTKGDDFRISLGQVLKKLKEGKSRREFLALTQEHLGIKKSKAYTLIAIADGKTTPERLREGYAKADAKRRLPAKSVHGHGQIDATHPDLDEVQEGVDDQTNQDDAAGLSSPSPVSTAPQNYLAGSGNDAWHTPTEIIEVARKVLGGIDLDPASNAKAQQTVKAGKFYAIEDNGLEHPWNGKVWLNPPFSDLPGFSDKLLAEIAAGRVTSAIFLSHNYTDTKWFHRLAAAATAICFTRDRIKFIVPETGKPQRGNQGQMLLYFGTDVELFRSAFEADVGYVVLPAKAGAAPAPTAAASVQEDADGSKLHALRGENDALKSEIEELQSEVKTLKAKLATAATAAEASPVVASPPLVPALPPDTPPVKLTKQERAFRAAKAHPELSPNGLMALPELEGILRPTVCKGREQFRKESGVTGRAKKKAARAAPPALAMETTSQAQEPAAQEQAQAPAAQEQVDALTAPGDRTVYVADPNLDMPAFCERR